MNIGTEAGAIPAKVSLNMRAMVTAGLAKEVEEVNQYAAPIQAATEAADSEARPVRARVRITAISPAVATSSPTHNPGAARACLGDLHRGEPEHDVGQQRAADAAEDLRQRCRRARRGR